MITCAYAAGLGCASPARRPNSINPYTPADLQQLRTGARDPKTFYLYIYTGPDGIMRIGNAHRIYEDKRVDLPMVPVPRQPLPCVEVRGTRGRALTALTDTSSPVCWTALDQRTRLGLEILGPELLLLTPDHVADEVSGVAAIIPELFVGDLRVEALLVYARAARGPLWPLSRDPRTAEAELVLGMDFLRSYSWVRWDFPNRRISFAAGLPYAERETDMLASLPLDSTTGPLSVRTEVDGQPMSIVIDLAGDFDVVMPTSGANELRQLNLGDLVLRRLEVQSAASVGVAGDRPRLGLRPLARFVITLDNQRRRLLIERPAPPATTLPDHPEPDESEDEGDFIDMEDNGP